MLSSLYVCRVSVCSVREKSLCSQHSHDLLSSQEKQAMKYIQQIWYFSRRQTANCFLACTTTAARTPDHFQHNTPWYHILSLHSGMCGYREHEMLCRLNTQKAFFVCVCARLFHSHCHLGDIYIHIFLPGDVAKEGGCAHIFCILSQWWWGAILWSHGSIKANLQDIFPLSALPGGSCAVQSQAHWEWWETPGDFH